MKAKQIRVLHVLQRMEAGGVQSFLMNLYRAINRDDIQFDFLVHYKEKQFYDDEINEMGGRLYKFSVRENYNVFTYKRDLRKFFSEHTEYVVLHGHMPTLSGIWMSEAAKAGIPTRIAHAHNAGENGNYFLKTYVKSVFRMQYPKNATDLFACSKAAGKFMFPGRDFHFIPNAIDIDRFSFSKVIRNDVLNEFRIPAGSFVIGNIGRMTAVKNQLFLLSIFSHILVSRPNSYLIIIGDGEKRSEIESRIESEDLRKHVLLLGKRHDVERFYQAFDAFVLPSLYEGLPLVGIEAQSSGCPSFFSDTVSREVGITKLAHFLSLKDSAERWANSILNLSNSAADRVKYTKEVREAGYDIKQLASRLSDFYVQRGNKARFVA